ncbi:MAG: neutral/alkaline non-lysosomal ceramidase N-terminal domain-containing protein [Clostridia bacterium]|nr:neutral/alkaline non-lysosomal ceramidase N-terminal domain-containing protein [Clostridia bacterium]
MYKCGFYESDITPPLGCSIPGYFRKRLGEDILERLHAKAAVISDGKTEIAFLVLDCLNLNYTFWERIANRIKMYTGIPYSNLIISSTHTHTGGSSCDSTDAEEPDKAYLEMLPLLAADAVTLAKKRMQPCTLRYASGTVEGFSFVRNYRMRDGSIRTNPGWDNPDVVESYSEPNKEFPLLFAEDESGNPLGVIANFALHNDCVAGNAYCADWAGRLGTELKKTYGEDFVTVCTTGPCGNINHNNYISGKRGAFTYRDIASAMAKEAVHLIENTEPVEGEISVVSRKVKIKTRQLPEGELQAMREFVEANEAPAPGTTNLASPESFATKYSYALGCIQKYDGMPPEKDILLNVFTIGDVCFYSMPGEVFSQFREMIKADTPFKKYFVITLANEWHHGYIPIREFENTPVYEADYVSNTLDFSAGYTMVETLLEMAQKLTEK